MMKTKYIKKTNKQYSIREDGKLIRHYIKRYSARGKRYIVTYKDVFIIPSKKTDVVVYVINMQQKRNTINMLLKEYFGFFLCKNCNNKHYNSKLRKSKCDNCINEKIKTYPSRSTEKIKEYNDISLNELRDSYIRRALKVPKKVLTKELIENKRKQLELHRLIKQI